MVGKIVTWMPMLVTLGCMAPTPTVQSGNTQGAYSLNNGSSSPSLDSKSKANGPLSASDPATTGGLGASRAGSSGAPAVQGLSSQAPTGPVPDGSAVQQLITTDAASHGGGSIIYARIDHLASGGQQNSNLQLVRQGMVKVLNSVSMAPAIVNLQAIDPAQSVYRINLADFKQANALGTLRRAPYADKNMSTVGGATVVKGDWLVYALSRPEIYDVIMNLPPLSTAFDAQLGVDFNKAVYVNTSKSEVTCAGRVLMRAPINLGGKPGGYYWRSYDFARPDVLARGFQNPQSLRTTSIPDLVAGEFFFGLPNGLQGYYAVGFGNQHRYDVPGSGGQSIDPPVATDYRRPQDGLTYCVGGKSPCGFVINGESCMSCHSGGINQPTVPAGTNGATADEINNLIQQDRARFASALREMGISPDAPEPILGAINVFRSTQGVGDKRRQCSETSGISGC